MTPPLSTHSASAALLARREFLTTAASGLGAIGLGATLDEDGVFAADVSAGTTPRTHFAPRAKNCIFIFMAGAPSHVDLFDPKPTLAKQDGQPMPESLLKEVRFAFIKKESARLMGPSFRFRRHGQCGMELSELLPHLGGIADDLLLVRSLRSTQFNHHPGQLLMQCGRSEFGLPSMGAWLNYGLGTASRNLPGYVVLSSGVGSSGGATLWQSGFLPTSYAGVPFRNQGEPVLNLKNPSGLPPTLQKKGIDLLSRINSSRYSEIRDPEISSRIASYELAYRMQMATPELINLGSEPKHIQELYGIDRPEPKGLTSRGKSGDTFKNFARNCLLARRMVERGVRFVNIVYASWDHHSNLAKELPYNAGCVDQPIAALIADLKQRGLLDSTIVAWGSEFGRTPLADNGGGKNTGRDHHPFAFSMLLAGGGLRGGHVHGKTDELGWGVVEKPVEVNDLQATLLHQFGLDHLKLTYRFQGRDFRLTDVAGNVQHEWLG